MQPKVVFEDKDLLVIDKPPGWIVNEAETTKCQPVVQPWIAANFKFQISNDKLFRNGIVHRLDKETSGILLVAKTKKAFENLQSQFKKRQVEKVYTALVHGKVEPEEETVKVPVGRLPWNRERFGVIPGGRSAETFYKVSAYYILDTTHYTLLTLYPKTGRTHQIRIHLKYLKHPIVSDEFYTGRKTARNDREWCPRLFLHASEIKFNHPKSGKSVSFKTDLPSDLKSALGSLST